MQHWIILGFAIVIEVIAKTALKSSEGFTRLYPTLIVLLGYLLAIYLLSLTFNVIPVGIAYAILAGMGIVLVTFFSWVLYKQALDFAAVIGITFIILGVVIINLFSSTTHF